MFDRISASFTLARNSWQVLRQDKKLIVFPILSGIGCFLVLASFILPLFLIRPAWLVIPNNGAPESPWPYVVAFAYYFCNYFVIVFCNAALISCALIRFNGGEPTVGEALVGHVGIGFFMFLLSLPGIAIFIIGAMLAVAQPVLGVPFVLLGLVYFLLLGAISSAMHGIYLGALYQYATHGSVPGGFDSNVLERAFSRKR
jgi:hypothetical protein